MAKLRVFISSTCFDLSSVRDELEEFFQELEIEPMLSEKGDIFFDSELHTHESCVLEVANSNMLILIVGGRFGGKAVPIAFDRVDVSSILKLSRSGERVDMSNISVTQLETLYAIQNKIPILAFVDKKVLVYHELFENNRTGEGVNLENIEIKYPGIPKNARFIFHFINFLRHRWQNNDLYPFENVQDIKTGILKQLSGRLQSILTKERKINDELSLRGYIDQRFATLESLILVNSRNGNEELAYQTLKYSQCIGFFLDFFANESESSIITTTLKYEELLNSLGVNTIIEYVSGNDGPKNIAFSGTMSYFYDAPYWSIRDWESHIGNRFNDFAKLPIDFKQAIVRAHTANRQSRVLLNIFIENENFNFWVHDKNIIVLSEREL